MIFWLITGAGFAVIFSAPAFLIGWIVYHTFRPSRSKWSRP